MKTTTGTALAICAAICIATPGAGEAAPRSAAQQENQPASPQLEALFWQSIVNSTDPADFEAYLETFPDGVFQRLAQVYPVDRPFCRFWPYFESPMSVSY